MITAYVNASSVYNLTAALVKFEVCKSRALGFQALEAEADAEKFAAQAILNIDRNRRIAQKYFDADNYCATCETEFSPANPCANDDGYRALRW